MRSPLRSLSFSLTSGTDTVTSLGWEPMEPGNDMVLGIHSGGLDFCLQLFSANG